MALDKEIVPIQLGQGLDTKTDEKQVLPGKLTALSNGIFQTPKEIRKRNGFQALSQSILGGGSIAAGVGLETYNSELTLLDGQNIYSLNSSGSNFANKGSLVTTQLSTSTVVRNQNNQTVPDSAINGSLQCFTWVDSSGGVRYSVFDTATEQSLVNNALVSATAVSVKCLAVGSYFVILYADTGTTLKYKSIAISTPTTLSSPTTIASNLNASNLFDATVSSNTIYLAYDNASTGVTAYSLSSSLVLSSPATTSTDHGLQALTVFVDSGTGRAWVAFSNSSNAVKYFVLTSALASFLTVTAIETLSFKGVNLTGFALSSTAHLYYEQQNASTPNVSDEFIKSATATDAGSVTTNGVFLRSVGLASKANLKSGTIYFWVTYQSTLQSTYFLVNQSAQVIAKLSPGNGGGLTAASILPELNLSGSTFQVASLLKDTLDSVDGNIFSQTGVISASVAFQTSAPSKEVFANNLHIAGGVLQMYDGAAPVEHGFHVYPEGLTASINAYNGGGTISGGIGPGASGTSINQFQYCATYEWTDNQGQIHKSGPGVAITMKLPQVTPLIVFTGTITNGTAGITSVSSMAGLNAGMYIYNLFYTTSIPHTVTPFVPNTIASVSGTTVTMSSNAVATTGTYTLLASSYPINVIADLTGCAAGSKSFTPISLNSANPVVGQTLLGIGVNAGAFPAGTTVTAYDAGSNTMTLSNPCNGEAFQSGTGNGFSGAWYAFADTSTASLSVPTLRLTQKKNVSISIWRTQCNGEVFYRLTSPTSPIANDTTVDSVSYTDTTPDSSLIGNDQLYTTGELENIAAPALSVIAPFKTRLIGLMPENPRSWLPSKLVTEGSPVEWNDSLMQNVNSEIGKVTAVHQLDEKVILFGPTSKYYVVGDGPANSGLNNDFTDAQKITGVTGCANQASILEIPTGLIYQDPTKGIYLLDRAFGEHYIGAEVESYNSQIVTAAEVIPNTTLARFTLGNGSVLTYDYIQNQWGQDAYPSAAVDSALYDNAFYYVTSAGLVLSEAAGTFTDNAAFVPLSLTTGWVNFAPIQGFQRIWHLVILGTWKSAHTLNVNIYVDYNDSSPVQTVAIPVLSNPGLYQFRIHMEQQTCEAVKVQIYDSQTSSYGEGFSLSSLTFEVGVKKGAMKLPAGNTY